MKATNKLLQVVIILLISMCYSPISALAASSLGEGANSEVKQDTPGTDSDREMYYQAVSLARKDQYEAAKRLLEQLIELHPAGKFADDAMYELARITDEEQSQFSQAVALYKKFLENYPSSRLMRRVQNRVTYLEKGLATGEEAFREFEQVRLKLSLKSADEGVRRLEALLQKHPDFSLRLNAMRWIANAHRRNNHFKEAIVVFERIAKEFEGSDDARRALVGAGECWMELGQGEKAWNIFHQLYESEGYGGDIARNYMDKLSSTKAKVTLFYLSLAVLILAVLLGIFAISVLRPPSSAFVPTIEVWMVATMFGAIFAATWSRPDFSSAIAWKTGLAVSLVLYFNGILAPLLRRKPLFRWLYLLLLILVGVSAAYAIIFSLELVDQVLYDAGEWLG